MSHRSSWQGGSGSTHVKRRWPLVRETYGVWSAVIVLTVLLGLIWFFT